MSNVLAEDDDVNDDIIIVDDSTNDDDDDDARLGKTDDGNSDEREAIRERRR